MTTVFESFHVSASKDTSAGSAALQVVSAASDGMGMLQKRAQLLNEMKRNEEELEETVESLEVRTRKGWRTFGLRSSS